MTISRDVFRTGMRHLAAGVCVITTSANAGGRFRLTATAVCSVSADPPTLLVCLNNSTTTCKEILESGRFAVNVLAGHDQEIAQVFASPLPPEERFNTGVWDVLETGAPVLNSAVAGFDCLVKDVVQVATHRIILGDIQALRCAGADVSPLLYARGNYGGFLAAESVPLRATHGSLANLHSAEEAQFLEDGLHWGLF